jgi:hypothetical protein
MLMVVDLHRLAPYQGAAWDERPEGGSSRSSWRVIIMRAEPRGRRRDRSQTSQEQPTEKKKWRYTCKLFGTSSFKEGPKWHLDQLLGNDREISIYTTAVAR